MVQTDPAKRPSMDEVVATYDNLVRQLSQSKLKSRLISRKEFFIETWIRDASHLSRGFFSRSSSRQGSSSMTRRS
jgi:hypothetical protein